MTSPTPEPETALPPKVAEALVRMFAGHGTERDGMAFELYLDEIARTVSILGPAGVNDPTMTAIMEGQRILAIKLLGARADVARMMQQREGEEPR